MFFEIIVITLHRLAVFRLPLLPSRYFDGLLQTLLGSARDINIKRLRLGQIVGPDRQAGPLAGLRGGGGKELGVLCHTYSLCI